MREVKRRVPGMLALGALAVLQVVEPRALRAQEAKAVETRVLEYWAKRQAKDLASGWTFYCAEYRARVSQPQFMQMTRLIRFELRDIKVARVELNGPKAEVTISYRFSIPTIPGQDLDGQATDTWSKGADGQWCKDDEPMLLPFPNAVSPSPATAGTPGVTPPSPSSPPGPPAVPPSSSPAPPPG